MPGGSVAAGNPPEVSPMSELLQSAAEWWVGTAIGGGAVLLAGCVLMRLARQPAARQRLGEYAVFAALVVAGLRLLPAWLPVSLPAPVADEPAPQPETVWVQVAPEAEWVARPESSTGVVEAEQTRFVEESGRATQPWDWRAAGGWL